MITVLDKFKIWFNVYRITYNEVEDYKFISIEVRCNFLFFRWWKVLKSFYITDKYDFDFQYNEAHELIDNIASM